VGDEHGCHCVGLEHEATGEKPERNASQRVEICAPIHHAAHRDFRREVGWRAGDQLGVCQLGSSHSLIGCQAHQIAVYAQDRWAPTSRLTFTAGLRLEVPFVPTPPVQNPALLAALGINTSLTPSGHPLWSPRLGISYDLNGRGTAFVRGGVGLFAGRPAYH
jgi:hypothetical protein